MAFQNLVAGCGDSNPLQQFVRSFASEKSDIQQDAQLREHREEFRQPPRARDPIHVQGPHLAIHDPPPRELSQFFHERPDFHDPLGSLQHEFEKVWDDENIHEYHNRNAFPHLHMPPHERHLADDWARQFEEEHLPWAEEFNEREIEHERWREEFHHRNEVDDLERAYRDATDEPEVKDWVNEFEWLKDLNAEDAEEEAWYQSFLKKEQERREAAREALSELSRKLADISDPKLQNSNFLKFVNKISTGELIVKEDGVVEGEDSWAAEFQQEQQHHEEWAQDFARKQQPQDWVEQFHGREREDWAADFQEIQHRNEWVEEFNRTHGEGQAGEAEEWVKQFEQLNLDNWKQQYDDYTWNSGANLDDYAFAENNPYLSHENPFQRGVDLVNRGQTAEAILAFEAEVQRNASNSNAWRMLGQCHAQNDKDDKAIAALRKAVSLNPNDLDALMSLGVSYTNEMYRDEALSALEKWIQTHPQYRGIRLDVDTTVDEWGNEYDIHGSPVDKQDKVTELFLKAARLSPTDPDADVQIALGLLYNLSFEYDKAVDCFGLALQKRPEDYLLWNKLGATLANSNKSEEAVGVYFRALDLNPNFVRARANLGISFLALKMYDQAAKHFLGALKMQPSAHHIWANLRTVFSSMERTDLLDKSMRFDVNEFTNEFDF